MKIINSLLAVVFGGQMIYYIIAVALFAFAALIFFAGKFQRTQETLRSFKKAFETMQLGVTITDVKGKILYTNPAEANMHDYSGEELIGRDVRVFAPPGISNPMTLEQIKNMRRFKRESVNIRKDRSVFPVQLMSDVVMDADGGPLGIITTCEDPSLIGESMIFIPMCRERLFER